MGFTIRLERQSGRSAFFFCEIFYFLCPNLFPFTIYFLLFSFFEEKFVRRKNRMKTMFCRYVRGLVGLLVQPFIYLFFLSYFALLK
jgi:hypothetical protein